MSEADEHLAQLPEAQPAEPRRHRPALVWLIPLIAALLGGWIALQSWLAKGPSITVAFRTADGIEPGKTLIRYKNVNVGSVTRVSFTKGGGVLVSATLTHDATQFLREDFRDFAQSSIQSHRLGYFTIGNGHTPPPRYPAATVWPTGDRYWNSRLSSSFQR